MLTKKNKALLTLGLIFGFLAFAGKLIYRPLLRLNNYHDYGINGFAPSFFYTISFCLIAASICKKKPKKAMLATACGSAVYELEQMYTQRTFDYKDLISIIIAFLLGLLTYHILKKKERLVDK